MTLDMVHLTRTAEGCHYAAYQIKSLSTKATQRTDDLLKISEVYAKEMGWTWTKLFKEDAPPGLLSNIKWVAPFVRREESVPVLKRWREVEELLYPVVSKVSLCKSCLRVDESLQLPPGSSLTIVRYLLANRIWEINWHEEVEPTEALNVISRQLEGTP